MPRFIDMVGHRYGSLVVQRLAERAGSGRVRWVCTCDCGAESIVHAAHLRSGHTTSCGCAAFIRRPALDRFAEKIALAESGCIEWLGGLNGAGYGQFYVGRAANPITGKGYAHRWSYEYHVGPIPEGMHLDHLCRNRACVNPEHLEPVTLQENLRRGMSTWAVNARKTHCHRNHPLDGANLRITTRGERRCKECERLQSRKQYWKDPEKYRAYSRGYKARMTQEA